MAWTGMQGIALVVLASAALGSCGFPPLPGPPAHAEQLSLLGFPDTAIRVSRSSYEFNQRLIIRDSVTYLMFWDSLAAEMKAPIPQAPAVNFDVDMVVVAGFGLVQRGPPPAAGAVRDLDAGTAAATALPQHSIEIEAVHYDPVASDIWIRVRSYRPTLTCEVPQFSTPVMAVRVPRRAGTPRWVEFGTAIVCN